MRTLAVVLLGAMYAYADSFPILLRAGASTPERIAALELSKGLTMLYPHHRFPVVPKVPAPGPTIRLAAQSTMRTPSPDAFAINAFPRGGAAITGGSPRAVLFAVYALLERLGFGHYLSYDTTPAPREGAIDFKSWEMTDEPAVPERIAFNWHNFLSSASTWEFEDWQHYIAQVQKMRYDGIMVHAYGNNPMFAFEFNGKRKPVGYLSTSRSGRDWGTQHVNDVRRLVGGDLFRSPVFGSSVAMVPEAQRSEAATNLMQQVFRLAKDRGLGVTFALDVDTESANPQELIRTLPASAHITSGKFVLANPDTPEGYSYYRAQVEQLLKTYPQITRLAVWFRRDGTPWRLLKPAGFPANWKSQYDAALAAMPDIKADPHAHSMFVMSKLVQAYARAVRELGRADIEIAAGSWRLDFVRAADRFFPRGVSLMPLDWEVIFDTAKGAAQLPGLRTGRRMLPIVWAHHDDHTYIGRPYTPFQNFPELLKQRGGNGYAVIHWTTRPLDLYFKSIAEQSWKSGAGRTLTQTCEDMAARTFGESARRNGGEYLSRWVREARMFGRETSDRFIDVRLDDAPKVTASVKERLALLEAIDATTLSPEGRDWLGYFRNYERFTEAFFTTHARFEKAQDLAKAGNFEGARKSIEGADPAAAIKLYAAAARRVRVSRGEEALIVSLNLRWLPFIHSMRQAMRLEPVRIKFQPTQHEPLAQGAGRNTFYFDKEGRAWRAMGEKETGAAAFESEGGPDELGDSGIRIDKPLTLKIGAMMGDPLAPGRYVLDFVFLARQASAGVRLQGQATPERVEIHETQQGSLIRKRFPVRVVNGFIEVAIQPGGNPPMLAALTIEPEP